jgi:hypothetical protein
LRWSAWYASSAPQYASAEPNSALRGINRSSSRLLTGTNTSAPVSRTSRSSASGSLGTTKCRSLKRVCSSREPARASQVKTSSRG